MNYSTFPSQRPNKKYITKRSAIVVKEFIREKNSETEWISDIITVDHCGKVTSNPMILPRQYGTFVPCLVYRRFALVNILYHDPELHIKPHTLWVTLAQNFIYVDHIWKALLEEVAGIKTMKPNWTSPTFDKYIITEALVRRHEPVYVSQYRARRTRELPNLSQTTANEEIIGWSQYTADLDRYHAWGGFMFGHVVPNIAVSGKIVERMLREAEKWYNDDDRPRILDPYTDIWVAFGWEPRDPFDPEVEDNEEGENEDDDNGDNGDDGNENDDESNDDDDDYHLEEVPEPSTSSAGVAREKPNMHARSSKEKSSDSQAKSKGKREAEAPAMAPMSKGKAPEHTTVRKFKAKAPAIATTSKDKASNQAASSKSKDTPRASSPNPSNVITPPITHNRVTSASHKRRRSETNESLKSMCGDTEHVPTRRRISNKFHFVRGL